MTAHVLVAEVIDAMELTQLPYMLAGSFSSNIYGIPRVTMDADFVIEKSAGSLAQLMKALGPRFKRDPRITFETVTGTIRHVVRITDSDFKLEVFELSQDAHDQRRFERRVRVHSNTFGRLVYIPTPEDVIVTKLRWARNKDRDDVAAVIGVQGNAIEWDYVHHWTEQHGTRALLDEIRATIPQID